MEKTETTDAFWTAAKESGVPLGNDYWVRRIGANKETVDIILGLVLSGEKCGTFGLKHILDRQPGPGPVVDADAVVVDMTGEPHAIVKTTQLTPVAYQDITEAHLTIEGPGARKLETWQNIHWPYWTKLIEPYGLEPSQDMMVMVEHFDLVFPRTV
ncbi:MAG: ASCH domain-containing protein [Alphaproteobacteria bacterium]|nr:ASCH domain-containing protein [Alphaproteobacteria bacterium]